MIIVPALHNNMAALIGDKLLSPMIYGSFAVMNTECRFQQICGNRRIQIMSISTLIIHVKRISQ